MTSTEPDAIREALKATPNSMSADLLFRLSDGLLIRTQGDDRDLLHYDYETPLLAWRKLLGWRVSDRDVVVGPLPPPDTLLDCSDLAAVLKNLLEDEKAIQSWPKLTRLNIRALLDYVRTQESHLSEKRLRRLENELETFVESREGLERLLATVLQNQKVKAAVEAAKQQVVKEYEATRTDLLRARQALEDDLKQLNAARSRLQEDKKKVTSDITVAVRKAFEKAQANGLETMADVAVIEALLGGRGARLGESGPVQSARESTAVTVACVLSIGVEPQEVLRRAGIHIPDARSIAQVVSGAFAVGLPVGLIGVGSGYIGGRLAAALCKRECGVIEVGIGLYRQREFNDVLATLGPEIDVVLVRGANSSDFSVYGAVLETEMIGRLSGESGIKPRSVLFSFEGGASALPIPKVLEELCLMIDLGWVNHTGHTEAVTPAMIGERIESAIRSGLGKLKADGLGKLLQACDTAGPIGDFWMEILLRNTDGAKKNTNDDDAASPTISQRT